MPQPLFKDICESSKSRRKLDTFFHSYQLLLIYINILTDSFYKSVACVGCVVCVGL